ncbi:hypothetical protein JTB14_025525 [Gonioctena quinquepunctata]|nr:hypothetical protein JTB14_025525 [Gonioctena quinquepunctata]
MSEEARKSLGRQRGAVKSKLTLFSNHLKTLEGKSLSEANIINLEERISKADVIFTDFDNLQKQIQNLVSESEIEDQHQERAVFEDTFFGAIASAKQIALKYKREHEKQISADASTDVSSNHDEHNVQVLKGVKFPVSSLPKFDGFISKSRLCTNCLKGGHFERTCEFGSCKQCNKRHNTLLHLNTASSSEQTTNESVDTTVGHQIKLSATSGIDEVLFSTVCVQVLDKFKNPVIVRAL